MKNIVLRRIMPRSNRVIIKSIDKHVEPQVAKRMIPLMATLTKTVVNTNYKNFDKEFQIAMNLIVFGAKIMRGKACYIIDFRVAYS